LSKRKNEKKKSGGKKSKKNKNKKLKEKKKGKKGKKKGGKKNKVGKKKKKAKKSKKNKNIKKKSLKGKKSRKNKKKKGVKGKKTKKSKKDKSKKKKKSNKNKKNKSKKNKKKDGKRTKLRQEEASCEVPDQCLANAVDYMNTLKEKVKNFNKQMKRIIRQNTTAEKKIAKRIEFDIVHTRLMNAAGGNRSDLKCGDSASGQVQVKNLSSTLDSCNADIQSSCALSDLPQQSMPEMVECKEKMDEFTAKVTECSNIQGAEACACWTDPKLEELKTSFKPCTLVSEATGFAAGIKSCLDAFGKCRKYEDVVGRYIYACDLNNAEVISKLKNIQANRIALEAANPVLDTLSSSEGRVKRVKAETCTDVVTIATKIQSVVNECPVSPDIKILADSVGSFKADCPSADKESLSDMLPKLAEALTLLKNIETEYQVTLEDLTGSTASPEVINAAEAYEAAGCVSNEEAPTTAKATTAKATTTE